MKKAPRVSEAEWEVMKAVWKKSPCSAQDIIDALPRALDWNPATVKTLLNRLIRKGALQFKKNGKAYVYSPAFTEHEFRETEAHSFLHRIFDGGLSPMFAHFVRSHPLSQEDLAELEKLVREGRKGK
jgi:BlaI family penicillinase repressor